MQIVGLETGPILTQSTRSLGGGRTGFNVGNEHIFGGARPMWSQSTAKTPNAPGSGRGRAEAPEAQRDVDLERARRVAPMAEQVLDRRQPLSDGVDVNPHALRGASWRSGCSRSRPAAWPQGPEPRLGRAPAAARSSPRGSCARLARRASRTGSNRSPVRPGRRSAPARRFGRAPRAPAAASRTSAGISAGRDDRPRQHAAMHALQFLPQPARDRSGAPRARRSRRTAMTSAPSMSSTSALPSGVTSEAARGVAGARAVHLDQHQRQRLRQIEAVLLRPVGEHAGSS